MAPTTSFWDCGEFIAASYNLSVPHPPGAPFYLLLGRLFTILPLADDPGLRVNLVSVVLSAFTILFLFLCIVRLIRSWRGPEKNRGDMITVYGSAAVGALAFAFSHSFWWNAVEAEVYSVSMFFTALTFYLALLWIDYADVPLGNRILLFIFYIIGLSSGVHLLNVLAMISVTYIISFQRREATFGHFIVTGLIGSGIILTIYPGIIQGLPTMIQNFSLWSVVFLLVILVLTALWALKNDHRLTAFGLLATLLIILGYSTYLLIKLRSGLDPFLDENNPETWQGLLAYLNREQYGSESLLTTMFQRKAPLWSYQIKHMYLRYLDWQFLDFPKFFGIPFIVGVVGAVHHFYKETKGAFTTLALFIMTGLAIVFYLNQDDPQPRERDYAYVGSFFAFAIWIGMGVVAIVDWVRSKLKNLPPATVTAVITLCLLVAIPLNMWTKNYHTHDRSGNYVAWDYSYNLLNTCEPNAILYTNGDNDTFPLWYLQDVEGVRQDVRVVNLSLLNTGWFIQQLRDKEPKMPLPPKFNDRYIENVIDARDVSALMDRRWQEKRKVSIDGPNIDSAQMVWEVPATLSFPVAGGKTQHFLRVQDLMILNTLAASKWERPIYFAVTVSDANLLGLRNIRDESKNFLTMEGLAFKITPEPSPLINADQMAHNMFNVYRYRGLDDPDIYFNQNIIKLLGNYRQALLQLAFNYLSEAPTSFSEADTGSGRPLEERIAQFDRLPPREKAMTALDFMDKRFPEELIPIRHDIISVQIGRLYAQLGRHEEMVKRLDRIVERGSINSQNAYEYGAYYLSEGKSPEKAMQMFQRVLQSRPTLENYQQIAYTWLQLGGDSSYVMKLYDQYLTMNNDRNSKLRVASQVFALGLDELAHSIYKPMWVADPGDKAAVQGLIEYHKRNQEYQRALTFTNDWLGSYPDDEDMQNTREELLKLQEKLIQP